MRSLFTTLLVLFAFGSAAEAGAAALLIDRPPYEGLKLAGWGYHLNTREGTAVADLHYFKYTDTNDGNPSYVREYTARVSVPGLTYDVAGRQVLFNDEGRQVVCATVKKKNGLFGPKLIITHTGLCRTFTVNPTWRTLEVYFEAHE